MREAFALSDCTCTFFPFSPCLSPRGYSGLSQNFQTRKFEPDNSSRRLSRNADYAGRKGDRTDASGQAQGEAGLGEGTRATGEERGSVKQTAGRSAADKLTQQAKQAAQKRQEQLKEVRQIYTPKSGSRSEGNTPAPTFSNKDFETPAMPTFEAAMDTEEDSDKAKDQDVQEDQNKDRDTETNSANFVLEALDRKLDPLTQGLKNLRLDFQTLNTSVAARLDQLELKLNKTDLRVEKLEQLIQTSPASDATIQLKLTELERQIVQLREGKVLQTDEREKTVVLGGLGALDSQEEAEEWLKEKLALLGGPETTETYCKGDFRGLLFAKFNTKADRDKAVRLLRPRLRQEGEDVWAKQDLPLERRVAEGFLRGMKNALVEWGCSPVRYYTDTLTLKAGGDLVVTTCVKEVPTGPGGAMQRKLVCTWEGAWATWAELHNSEEVKQLLVQAEGALKQGGGGPKGWTKGQGKAKGKGKPNVH